MYTRTTEQICLDGARAIVDAALAEATARGAEISVAVVDAGGHLTAFARTDNAELQTIKIAEHKARSSAFSGIPTGSTSKAGNVGSDHHLLAITLAAGPENWVTVPGGAPVTVNGVCVGGVAVSGAGHSDAEIALAAAAMVDAVSRTSSAGSPPGPPSHY